MEPLSSLDPARSMMDIFGFGEIELRDHVVARAAAASRSYAIGLFPLGASGSVRYFHTVANLRERFAAIGYHADDGNQVARTVHAERGVAIVTAAGNEFTGIAERFRLKPPSTKWPKGPSAERAVAQNNRQIELFTLPEDEAVEEPPSPVVLTTWMLLQHADEREVRSELSLPSDINARGFVTSWQRRFILPPVSNEGGPRFDIGDDDDGIDIAVEPR